jgi:hypothetical protein
MLENREPAVDYKVLVQDDRIHAFLYTDPRIFAHEMERIFQRGWVFVATTARSASRRLRHPLDRGRARDHGAGVRGRGGDPGQSVPPPRHDGCAIERSHARTCTCPYHGWTYDVGGALLGVPYPGGYAWFHKSALCLRLQRESRVRTWGLDGRGRGARGGGARSRVVQVAYAPPHALLRT